MFMDGQQDRIAGRGLGYLILLNGVAAIVMVGAFVYGFQISAEPKLAAAMLVFGVGMIAGFGLKRGAIAGSIGHDAHNIMVVGAADTDMLAAIATVAEMQGGLAVVADGEVVAALPLPIAGLMSDPPLEAVAADYDAVEAAARSLGATAASPFGQLAFLGISVIPAARVTDRGFLEVG